MVKDFFRSRVKLIILLAVCCGIFAAVFNIYSVDRRAVPYAGAVCLAVILIYTAADFVLFSHRVSELRRSAAHITLTADELPEPSDPAEEVYAEMVRVLFEEKERADSDNLRRFSELSDYYTMWTHQIKVPIAAARLILQSGEPDSAEMSEQLRRIEEYTEMVMSYARVQSDISDYVIGTYPLDEIVHNAVKDFSPQFVRKKLTLSVKKSGKSAVTDKKQLSFVLGQVISNAVKYTEKGGVEIYCEGDELCVKDTGIGISPDDLPRIFEKGYTGLNGRLNAKSSGIGLYLCRKICDKLGHRITAQSGKGGTVIRIDLSRDDIDFG